MRSSNAPFNEQGFAEIIRDIERHELLLNQGGDTNPGSGTNLGYGDSPTTSQDADEGGQSVTDAIAAHVAEEDPHEQYLLRDDYTAATPVLATVNTVGGGQVLAATSNTTVTGWSTTGTDTLTGFDTSTGVLTVPTTGLYHVSAYLWPTYGGGTGAFSVEIHVNGAVKKAFGRAIPYPYNSLGGDPSGVTSGTCWLTAGDLVKLVFNNSSVAATLSEAALTIAKLA